MIPFPDEESRTEHILEYAHMNFEFAERAYRVWMETGKWPKRANTPRKVFDLGMMLNLQACRLYRSIVEECRRCEGFSANILSRSLFETVLALKFVLSRHVRISAEPVMDGTTHKVDKGGKKMYSVQTSKKLSKQKTKYPNIEQRASFYYAQTAFNDVRFYDKLVGIPKMNRTAKSAMGKLADPIIKHQEDDIGEAWVYVLRKEKNYSGLKVADLARVLGKEMERWYLTIYDLQSGIAHGTQGLKHGVVVDGQVTPLYMSDDSEITGILDLATAMFLGCMKICHECFDHGIIAGTMINGLAEEFLKSQRN